ncbi:MAG TPA: polyphosphate kinase 2 family protein [Chthoniobacterales bacterium]|nr:polyphosphate kinase 2 family protein [Chthoniobacterales bacterium]
MIDFEKHLPKKCGFDPKKIVVPPGQPVGLAKDFETDYTGTYKDKKDAEADLPSNVQRLADQQDLLYASNTYALLILFQALDAAGKDGTIKHVMSGVNPQGCQVQSFKVPSAEELDHDYLWRTTRTLPRRGQIGIFNRSYYEEVLVTRVHPEILARENLPAKLDKKNIWKQRFDDINNFERYLTNNGTVILKFFLNVSKDEQKKRFLRRIEEKEKNWKFSAADIRERQFWPQYVDAYEQVFTHTSTPWAPWLVIPADHKWFTRLCVSQVIVAALKSLGLRYPTVPAAKAQELEKAKQELLSEQ